MTNREQAEPQYPSGEEVSERVDEALRQFRTIDRDLIHIDANERSITHKLAQHLEKVFPGWHLDCEYNRDDNQIKRWRQECERSQAKYKCLKPDDTEVNMAYPDIIVHRRRTSDNLLMIEVKKWNNRQDTEVDKKKLSYFTKHCGHFGYLYGLLLVFGDTADDAPCQLWFTNGQERCTSFIRKL